MIHQKTITARDNATRRLKIRPSIHPRTEFFFVAARDKTPHARKFTRKSVRSFPRNRKNPLLCSGFSSSTTRQGKRREEKEEEKARNKSSLAGAEERERERERWRTYARYFVQPVRKRDDNFHSLSRAALFHFISRLQ